MISESDFSCTVMTKGVMMFQVSSFQVSPLGHKCLKKYSFWLSPANCVSILLFTSDVTFMYNISGQLKRFVWGRVLSQKSIYYTAPICGPPDSFQFPDWPSGRLVGTITVTRLLKIFHLLDCKPFQKRNLYFLILFDIDWFPSSFPNPV